MPRLIKNKNNSDEESEQPKKKKIVKKQRQKKKPSIGSSESEDEKFDKFKMIDDEKLQQGKIDYFINKQSGNKQQQKRKEQVIFQSTIIDNFSENCTTHFNNPWGLDPNNFSSDNESEIDLRLQSEYEKKDQEQTTVKPFLLEISQNKYKTMENLSQVEMQIENNQTQFSQINSENHKETLNPKIQQKNKEEAQKIFTDQITNVRFSGELDNQLSKQSILKPLSQINFYIHGQLKTWSRQKFIEVITHLGAKFHIKLPFFVTNLWIVSDGPINEKQLQEKLEKRKNIYYFQESQIDQKIIDLTGKNIQQIIIENSNEDDKTKEKILPKPETNSDKFFGAEVRDIQKTQELVNLVKKKNSLKDQSQSNPQSNKMENEKPILKDQKSPNQYQVSNFQCKIWTEKYRPQKLSECISNEHVMQQLMCWLKDWSLDKKDHSKFDGQYFQGQNKSAKAALLSGPPGVGKTTGVRIIAKHLGFELIEWNASDLRSKLALEGNVRELANNRTLVLNHKFNEVKCNNKTVILMDEVDGMTGSDKGGTKALIDMISITKVPIVCICNDRFNQKIKSLANHCLDLRFKIPDEKSVLSLMIKICENEKIPYNKDSLQKRIKECQCDIRQLINSLQISSTRNDMQTIGQKDKSVITNIFDATKNLLNYNPNNKISDLLDTYFIDFSVISNLYQENYLNTTNDIFKIAQASVSLAEADIINKRVRRNNDWSLMPQVGFLQTIYPTQKLESKFIRKVEFTQLLGKMSSMRKSSRLLIELKDCLQSNTFNCGPQKIKYGYIEVLAQVLVQFVNENNYNGAVDFIQALNLPLQIVQENVMELLSYYPKRNLLKNNIDTNQKTKLMKLYKKKQDSTYQNGERKKKFQVPENEFHGQENQFQEESEIQDEEEKQSQVDEEEIVVIKKKNQLPKKQAQNKKK